MELFEVICLRNAIQQILLPDGQLACYILRFDLHVVLLFKTSLFDPRYLRSIPPAVVQDTGLVPNLCEVRPIPRSFMGRVLLSGCSLTYI
jgi:hypothetical protein